MRNSFTKTTTISLPCILAVICFATPLGTFDGDNGIAETQKPGRAEFNSASREYSVTGVGGDIGGTSDGFHYVWKKVSGDVFVNADVRFVGVGAANRRKAALMIRQSLDPRSAYAAAALQGDGIATLQYRPDTAAASQTDEVMSGTADMTSAVHLSLSRRGNAFTVSIGKMMKTGGTLPSRAPVTVTMNGPVYVGLAVSSYDAAAQETAVFSNVMIQTPGPQ